MSWWAWFLAVLAAVLVLALVGAALADRRARARGYRLRPDLARSLRRGKGELRRDRSADVLGERPGRPRRGQRRP